MDGNLGNLADVMHDAVILVEVTDDKRQVIYANSGAETLFGYSHEELSAILPNDLLAGGNDLSRVEAIRARAEAGEIVREALIFQRKDRSQLWVDVQVSRVPTDDGRVLVMSVLRDISHTKSLERRLETAEAEVDTLEQRLVETQQAATIASDRLMAAVHSLPDALVIWDAEDKLVTCNDAYYDIYPELRHMLVPGTPFEDILDTTAREGLVVIPDGKLEEWRAERLAAHRNPGPPIEQDLTDGRCIRLFDRVTERGDIVGCRIDVTSLKSKEAELRERTAKLEAVSEKMRGFAMHDALTGLPNRRHLDAHLKQLRDENGAGSVGALHIDLDNFKQINDRLGHAAGDSALQFAADALRRVTRDNDSVFRTGGDEFVMIVSGNVTKSLLVDIGERVVSALSEPFPIEQQSCRLGASVGVSLQDVAALSPEELLATSDMALFEAKRRGRGQVRVFTVDLKRKMRRQQRLADDLLAGIETGQFFPVYQPQIDARTRQLVGVETLCRWDHPGRGIVGPDEFLPIARDLKVMSEIDQQIYDAANRDLDHLGDLGLRLPRISFNLELERLMDSGLLPALRRISARGTRVAVELLESLSLDEKDTPAIWAVDSLRDGGIEVEIDDFGSCRASLLGVLNVRPNVIKIDRALVNSVINLRAQRDIIRALVNLANTLEIRVTAEGVESDSHGDMLTSLGCHTLQGYSIARPMAIDDLEMYLKSRAEQDRNRRQSNAMPPTVESANASFRQIG